MPRYAFDCEFDGRHWQGTQSQRDGRTLQAVLGQALAELAGESVQVRPASRLDAGVSAEHLPVDAALPQAWSPRTLLAALNARLPRELVVVRLALVDERFHCQHDARSKRYRYDLLVRPTRPALEHRATWVRQLDHPELLPGMAQALVGTRDGSGFACLRHDGTDEDDPVRTILHAAWEITAVPAGSHLRFAIEADGFLYKQIRGMVGAMIAVAQGRRALEEFHRVLAGGRAAARLGNIAPAHGLTLEAVRYAPEPAWWSP